MKCSDPQLPDHVLKGRTREKLLGQKKWWFVWEGKSAKATRVGHEYDKETLRTVADILSEVAEELEKSTGR